MTTYLIRFCIVLLLAAALIACQGQGPETNQDQPAEAGRSKQVESDNDGEEITEGQMMTESNGDQLNLEQAVDAALQDLAERNGITPEAINVIEARVVTWRNGALGCPEEGMMYTQALVEGFYIRLGDGESEYAYHAGRDGKPFHCPAARSEAPPESGEGNPTS